jgi:hypothetical protein
MITDNRKSREGCQLFFKEFFKGWSDGDVLGTKPGKKIGGYGVEAGSENLFSRKCTFARWHLGQVH